MINRKLVKLGNNSLKATTNKKTKKKKKSQLHEKQEKQQFFDRFWANLMVWKSK